MSLIDRINCFLFPLECKKKKRKQTPMDRYIERHNPQSLEDVERLAKQYLQGTSAWGFHNDNLYR